ncbi:MAG: helix-turn-helix domain-containing protein [Acidobacteriota bacterium]
MISQHLAAARHDERLTFFDASGPIFSCREDDEGALRFAAAMLTEPGLGLAGPSQIAKVVGRHRSRVHDYRKRLREGGTEALEVKRRGPRGPSKLKGNVLARAQRFFNAGLLT